MVVDQGVLGVRFLGMASETLEISEMAPHADGVTFAEFLADTAEQPIYVILGVQGSGTNLLSRLLRNIFGFSVLHDGSLVLRGALRAGHGDRRAARASFDHLLSLTFPSTVRRKMGGRFIRPNELYRGVASAFDEARIETEADFARFFYAYRAYNLATSLMAVKSDDLWEVIGQLDVLLPNRRTILLTRDFRDNALSVSGKNFGPVEPACAAQYVKHHFAFYQEEYERRRHEAMHVKYEALLQSPLEFAERFQQHFSVEPVRDPAEAIQRVGIRSTNARKWERMSVRDLKWCEGILRSELQAYGYELSQDDALPPSGAELWNVRARDLVKRIPQKLGVIGRRLAR